MTRVMSAALTRRQFGDLAKITRLVGTFAGTPETWARLNTLRLAGVSSTELGEMQ
jgi:hypothetical protein